MDRPNAGEGLPAPQPPLASDLLRGAGEIAEFLLGSASERRTIYHLKDTSRIPIFRIGSMLCARKSVLMKWIADQEERR
jgi:hypothetical protein